MNWIQKLIVAIAAIFMLAVFNIYIESRYSFSVANANFKVVKYAWIGIAIGASGLVLAFHKWEGNKSASPSRKLLKKNRALKTEIANRKLELELEKLKAELDKMKKE